MKMRGSIPARKPKMTLEQLAEQKRVNREKKADANKQNREPGGADQWIEARVIHGTGQPVLDEVPQPEDDQPRG